MRYENDVYGPRDAGAADLISGGRLQPRHQPGFTLEQVNDGWRILRLSRRKGENESDMARRHSRVPLRKVLRGEAGLKPNPQPIFPSVHGGCCVWSLIQEGRERIW